MLLQHVQPAAEIRPKNRRRSHPFLAGCRAQKILREIRPISEHLILEAHQTVSRDGVSKASDNGFPEQYARGDHLLDKHPAALQRKHLGSVPLLAVPLCAGSHPLLPGQKLSPSRSIHIRVHSRADCCTEESADEPQEHAGSFGV